MGRRRRRPEDHPRVQHLFEQARANERGTPPRKHHIVPSSYLERWAEKNRVRMTETDTKATYEQSPKKCERATDFYRIQSPDLSTSEVPPLLFETMLSNVEGEAKSVMDDLGSMSFEDVGWHRMSMFAWFLSFQVTRGKSFRARHEAMVADVSRLQLIGSTAEGLLDNRGPTGGGEPDVAELRDFLERIQGGSTVMRPQIAEMVGHAASLASKVWDHLILQRDWTIYKTAAMLITCDEPVVRIGGPRTDRRERPGLEGARVLAFPLNPSEVLIMTTPEVNTGRPHVLDRNETLDLNREILAHSSRWSYEKPSRHITEKMHVPPDAPPYQRELVRGTTGPHGGEVHRMHQPSRWWKDAEPPSWPVARWWA